MFGGSANPRWLLLKSSWMTCQRVRSKAICLSPSQTPAVTRSKNKKRLPNFWERKTKSELKNWPKIARKPRKLLPNLAQNLSKSQNLKRVRVKARKMSKKSKNRNHQLKIKNLRKCPWKKKRKLKGVRVNLKRNSRNQHQFLPKSRRKKLTLPRPVAPQKRRQDGRNQLKMLKLARKSQAQIPT